MQKVRGLVAAAALMAPAVAVGITTMPGGASASSFSITAWGLPNGVAGGSSGTTIGFGGGPAINAADVAVGAGQVGTFPGPPALKYGGGQLTVLPKLDFGALADQSDYATGINSSNVIAGIGLFYPPISGSVSFQALEWSGSGVTDLSPGINALATSINDTGTVVGYQDFGGATTTNSEAVQFHGGRALTYLGYLPQPSNPPNSAAFGISEGGQIVGEADNSANQNLPVTFSGGVATALPLPAGANGGVAAAISPNNGHIVGSADLGNAFQSEAAQFGPGRPSLLGILPGDAYSTAEAVNSAGVAVGYAGTNPLIAANDTRTAVMYLGGQDVNLNNYLPLNSGWQLMEATGINDSDVVAGVGLYQGHVEGFTMTLPTFLGIIIQPLIVLPPLINLPIASLPLVGPTLNAALNTLLGL